MRVIAGPFAGVLRMPWRKFAIFNFSGRRGMGQFHRRRRLFVWPSLAFPGPDAHAL